jgi:hypothetical protein
MNTAMRGGVPDRIPVWCLLSLEHIINHGANDGKIPGTIEELVTAECNLAKQYNFDGSLIYLPGTRRGTDISSYITRSIRSVPQGDLSHIFQEADPESWERDIPEYQVEDFYSSHLAREILGEDYHIGGWAADGFSRAIQWFPSLEEAMMATIQDPARFEALVNYFDDLSIAWAKAQIELGKLESIQISSPYAGASFISVNMYKDLVFSSVQKLAEAIKPLNGFSYLHTCGFISDRLELMGESGIDGLECMDPPPLGNVTLSDAKSRVGSKLFLKGNIDSVNVLLRGDEETVDKTVRETIESGISGGGYILSTACSVAPDVPPGRVRRLRELAEEYGRY